jgi:Ala-tRNA(Pro) deacylase
MPFTVLRHRAAIGAQYQAAFAHVPGRSWAKTVMCWTDAEPVLVVVPAHLRVDLEALRLLANAATVRLAAIHELAELFPGCEPGAISPLAAFRQLRVFVDRSFVGDPQMVFNAGTSTDAVSLHYYDFAELTSPIVGAVATAQSSTTV